VCPPKIKVPAPTQAAQPGAAPAAPLPTADALRMQERETSRDGAFLANTARSRRTLRTDIRISGARTGVNIARMGA
jgi:hypothetical protein